jgi:uncharacterized OsmC-like protein
MDMADAQTIRMIADRHLQLLAARPQRGLLTAITRAKLDQGLRCEISEGAWRFHVDMPAKVGGDDTAPTPGVLGRGALAGCLGIGIACWAARLEIPLDTVVIEVEADFDARGELGVEGVTPGYSEVRYRIAIESPASPARLDQLVAKVERHSPYLDVFGRALRLRRTVRLNGREV